MNDNSMNIIVMGMVSGIGKSVVTATLLFPFLPRAKVISLETLNLDTSDLGIEVEKMNGTQLPELIKMMLRNDNLLIDAGMSTTPDLIKAFRTYGASSFDDVGAIILPCTRESRVQRETCTLINTLISDGIDPNRIVVLLNKIPMGYDFEGSKDLQIIEDYAAKAKFIYSRDLHIVEKGIIEDLGRNHSNLLQIASDPVNYRTKVKRLIENGATDEEIEAASNMHTLTLGARTLYKEMQDLFGRLMTVIHERNPS